MVSAKSILIRNIGTLITGDIRNPRSDAETLYIENGKIKEIGTSRAEADVVIDAKGLMVTPGFIDSHVHPACGGYTPVQECVDWITPYLHGGTTSMVSAGELHVPGLPFEDANVQVFKHLAILSRHCYASRPAGVKIEAGTMIVLPGLEEKDFDELAEAGCKNVKFIYFPYEKMEQARQYVAWAHDRGMIVKIHSGGVSRSGVNVPAGAEVIFDLRPDIVGHICGGPIPMKVEDIVQIIESKEFFIEICYCGNFALIWRVLDLALQHNVLDRIILGTDTPSGTGVTPRAMLRLIAFIGAHPEVQPEIALCMATGNTAKAHRLEPGIISEGKPADLLILGNIAGSEGKSPLENLALGNILAIALVMIDGQILICGRSKQLPPPEVQIGITYDDERKAQDN